jgi:thioredoxin 1
MTAMRRATLAIVAAVAMAWAGWSGSAQVLNRQIYPPVSASPANVKAAIAEAKRTHRRVIVDFGGDWCGDCQVLNIYFHQSPNAELLEKNFVLVDVNIGHIDQNLDLGEKYGVVLHKGVPALAVLDGDGNVIYGQKSGEFENMRNMKPQDVTDFLNKWKR